MKRVLFSLFALVAQNLVIDVNLRQIDVFVEDQRGGAALDLTSDDFKVIEDGVPKPVKHFALEVAPVAVGIVLDRSSSIRKRIVVGRPRFPDNCKRSGKIS